ncbi:MAG: hypothetical protein ABSF29_10150 [Tepidisphaeraceae bacterium]
MPKGPDGSRRDLGAYVVTRGIPGLVQGSGPIKKIVIPCDTTRPTLDDMLAASFVQRLIEGAGIPAGAATFAKYAALAREGLQPGDMPLDSSMEGIFLAIRNDAGNDLTDPTTAAQFLSDWDRVAQTILRAADAGKDPFVSNLFGESSQFARERAFLKKDETVYREDVRRGQQWIVHLPGGPPTSAMLLLEQPKSLLWKYWSRRDTSAPAGSSYLLLVVDWGRGNWVISTDPIQRLSIKELAETLQAAELQKSPNAGADPWFDGAPFGHTLVAAPKGGTKLGSKEIQTILKKWGKGRPAADVRRTVAKRAIAVIGGSLGTLILSVLASMLSTHFNKSQPANDQPATQPTAAARPTSAPAGP